MTDPYTPRTTCWLHDADDPDAFWRELSAFRPGRSIRLHLRDGSSDQGSFGGTEDVTGLVYSPEPDGQASIVANDHESMRNHLRVDIVGFMPLQ